MEREVYGSTIAYVRFGDLVVFASAPDMEPAADEWEAYIRWLKGILAETGRLRGLILAGHKPPTARQRSYLGAQLRHGDNRAAVVLRSTRLMPIVRIFRWLIPNTEAFKPSEVKAALAYLGVSPEREILQVIDYLAQGDWSAPRRDAR
jgi:hypothetical protein